MSIASRITGAMLGLACGDALGAPAEFKDKQYVQKQWGTLTQMVGGGVWKPGEWTDDTGMALCIAEGILASPDDPIEETGKRFLEWRKTAKDVGNTISAALSAYKGGPGMELGEGEYMISVPPSKGDWTKAAKSTPQAQQGKAAGNGSLMRTLPVALAYGPERTPMLSMAARLSAMTHWDGEAETCCVVYCLWVTNVLEGKPLEQAWHEALREGREVAGRGQYLPDAPGGSRTFETEFWPRLEAVPTLTYDQLQPSGYAGYAVECLEAAAWCVLNAKSLEEVLVKSVNLAGEADTIAAVAGGVAGAYWGIEAIPQRWLDKLYKRAELDDIATRLAALRRHRTVYATKGLPAFNHNWVTDQIMAGRNPLTCYDVQQLSDFGITHILDLREPKEWALPKFGAEAIAEIQRRGLQLHQVPVRDTREPTVEALDNAYQFLEDALIDKSSRIYVHCRAGNERTAAILIGYYARHHGASYDEALSKLRAGRPTLNPLPDQEQAVRQWLESNPHARENGAAPGEDTAVVWDGITESKFLTPESQKLRQRLSDAAKHYDWRKMLKLLSQSPELVNVTRPGGTSLFTPLHQAAHGGAPVDIVVQLLNLGAWRTLQNARGERPLDIAVRQDKQHLHLILEPHYRRHVPLGILLKIQEHFHEVIRGRISQLDSVDRLRLPHLEPLLEFKEAKFWFAVSGMYGGFHYWLEEEGVNARLLAESWCRVAGGSGQRHEVTSAGSRLTDEGFV